MIDLGNVGLGTVLLIAAIVILLLTPLFGEIFGRFFEEAATFIAKPLRSFAEIIESIKDWVLAMVTGRFKRQAALAQPAPAQPTPTTTTTLAPAAPQDVNGVYDSTATIPPGASAAPVTVNFAQTDQTAQTGALAQPVATAPQAQPAPAQTAAPQVSEQGHWHIEAFMAEFLYFALVIAVCLVDLVYSAERMSIIILNQEGGIDFGPLNFLRDLGSGLAGVLFVGIGLLAGMLVFDLIDVLPRGVQLFPDIKKGARRVLLLLSIAVLAMAAVAAALLWALGQTVVDNLNVTFPELEYVVDVLLAVVLLFVVTLGVWGLIRGLAAIGAILLVIASGVMWVLSHLLIAAADLIEAIGRAVSDVFVEIYHMFHPARREPAYAPYGGGRLVVMGLGQHSSNFAAQLCLEIHDLAGSKQLLGAGVYAQSGTVYGKARNKLRTAGVSGGVARGPRNLSVEPTQQSPMELLEKNIVRAYHEADPQGNHRTVTPRHLVWVVDPDEVDAGGEYFLARIESMLEDWRTREHLPVPGLTVTIVCLLPHRLPKALEESQILDRLSTIVKNADRTGTITITPSVLIIRDNTDTKSDIGSETALSLFARSLAGSLVSTAMKDYNSGMLQALAKLQEYDFPFVAMNTDAIGIVASNVSANRRTRSLPFLNDVMHRTEDLAQRMFNGGGATTVKVRPDVQHPPIAAVVLAPIAADTADARTYADTINRWYADDTHYVPMVDFVLDEHVDGVDISRNRPKEIGDRYVQIAHLYGADSVDAALGKAPAQAVEQAQPQEPVLPVMPLYPTPTPGYPQQQPGYEPAYVPQPSYGQQPSFAQQPTYMPPSYGQTPAYGQQSPYAPTPGFGQQPSYGQQSGYDQAAASYGYGQQPPNGQQPNSDPSNSDSWLNYPRASPDANNGNGKSNGNGSLPHGPWGDRES
jgi:hypothetical protein